MTDYECFVILEEVGILFGLKIPTIMTRGEERDYQGEAFKTAVIGRIKHLLRVEGKYNTLAGALNVIINGK